MPAMLKSSQSQKYASGKDLWYSVLNYGSFAPGPFRPN